MTLRLHTELDGGEMQLSMWEGALKGTNSCLGLLRKHMAYL